MLIGFHGIMDSCLILHLICPYTNGDAPGIGLVNILGRGTIFDDKVMFGGFDIEWEGGEAKLSMLMDTMIDQQGAHTNTTITKGGR